MDPIYPSVDFSKLQQNPQYQPVQPTQQEQHQNPPPQQTSPTISQILRDFDSK